MLLDSNIKDIDLKFIIKKFLPEFIFCSTQNQKKIPKDFFNLVYSFNNFNLLKNKKKNFYKINDQLMILISTSGSLGEPKFVKLSSNNIVVNTRSIISYLNLQSFDRTITTMPMSYSYGFSIINTHLSCGGSIVPNNLSLVDKNFWKLYSNSNPSNINGVPFFYEMLNRIGFKRILKNKPRFITQAGGKIKKEIFENIAKECLQNNISFYLMYGQTEAGPRISYHKVKKSDLNTGDIPIGKSVPEGKLFLRDNNNLLIKNKNVEGNLIYKGKNIFGGYAKSYLDLNSFDNIIELETGDVGFQDKMEKFYISGRKSRFIKIYGYRLNLDYVEEKLNSIGLNVACIGINEKLYIFSLTSNFKLGNFIDLPKNAYKIILLKEFPLNDNGKISYSSLTKLIDIKD
jgi:long-subunit acyl-CoA synthetase (AMP-forming)